MAFEQWIKAGKEKTTVDKKDRVPKIIHMIVSIIYIPVIVLILPYIHSSITSGYFDPGAYIAAILIIGSVFTSKILIDKGRILTAFLILFIVPGLAFLYFLPGHM